MLLIRKLLPILVLFLFVSALSIKQSEDLTNSQPEIKRIRIDFKNPDGFVRHLMLGFVQDNSATDGIDMGYDARNVDNLANDLNWVIDKQRFVIQGVGQFDNAKKYSLGLFMNDPGEIEISLDSLENFDSEIPVYLFDTYTNSYTLLNENSFKINVESGTDIDRFLLAFSVDDNTLDTDNHELENTLKFFKNHSDETLVIESKGDESIESVTIYGIQGKRYFESLNLNQSRIAIPSSTFKNSVIAVYVKVGDKQNNKLLVIE